MSLRFPDIHVTLFWMILPKAKKETRSRFGIWTYEWSYNPSRYTESALASMILALGLHSKLHPLYWPLLVYCSPSHALLTHCSSVRRVFFWLFILACPLFAAMWHLLIEECKSHTLRVLTAPLAHKITVIQGLGGLRWTRAIGGQGQVCSWSGDGREWIWEGVVGLEDNTD